MASSSSWFTRSTIGKQQFELPRWRSQSPMSASIIPAPIVESTYQPARRMPQPTATSVIIEEPTSNSENELQADLQYLLDAQAEALISGMAGPDENTPTGSSTPTARSLPRQINKPVRRRVGLRSARKGIFNCIMALSAIKQDQSDTIQQTLQEREQDLARMEKWEKKREKLQHAITKVDDGEESVRVSRLKEEADVLQTEITEVEAHLEELKTKRGRLLKQAAAVENSVQAKMASYTSSLNMLEEDVRSFLASERNKSKRSLNGKQIESDQDRQSLDIAREDIQSQQQDLQSQLDDVQLEKSALDDGAEMWKKVSAQVTEFEKQIRAEMSSTTNMQDSVSAWDDTSAPSSSTRLKELHTHLEDLIKDIEQELQNAEAKDWKLLVAAIGAELEALKHGKNILDGVVDSHVDKSATISIQNGNGLIGQIDEQAHQPERQNANRARSDTDEEPDPDLLFSVEEDESA